MTGACVFSVGCGDGLGGSVTDNVATEAASTGGEVDALGGNVTDTCATEETLPTGSGVGFGPNDTETVAMDEVSIGFPLGGVVGTGVVSTCCDKLTLRWTVEPANDWEAAPA